MVCNKEAIALSSREIILEYQRIGPVVKVSAIDPHTLIEVTIQGPASWGEAALRRTALAKLDYVLARKGLTRISLQGENAHCQTRGSPA